MGDSGSLAGCYDPQICSRSRHACPRRPGETGSPFERYLWRTIGIHGLAELNFERSCLYSQSIRQNRHATHVTRRCLVRSRCQRRNLHAANVVVIVDIEDAPINCLAIGAAPPIVRGGDGGQASPRHQVFDIIRAGIELEVVAGDGYGCARHNPHRAAADGRKGVVANRHIAVDLQPRAALVGDQIALHRPALGQDAAGVAHQSVVGDGRCAAGLDAPARAILDIVVADRAAIPGADPARRNGIGEYLAAADGDVAVCGAIRNCAIANADATVCSAVRNRATAVNADAATCGGVLHDTTAPGSYSSTVERTPSPSLSPPIT